MPKQPATYLAGLGALRNPAIPGHAVSGGPDGGWTKEAWIAGRDQSSTQTSMSFAVRPPRRRTSGVRDLVVKMNVVKLNTNKVNHSTNY